MPTSNESTTGRSITRAICIDTGLPIGDHVVRQSKLRLLKQLQDHVSRMLMLLVERTAEMRSEIIAGAKIQRGKLRWNPDLGCVMDDSHRANTSAS